MVIKWNNDLYSIFNMVHRTPGNLRAFVQVRMRNLRNGSMVDNRFSSTEQVERAILDEQEMEYLYDDGDNYTSMNTESFEQVELKKDLLGDAVDYLIPNIKVHVEFYEGKPMSVELPPSVELTVLETEPGLKGSTVSNVTKPAKTDTGLVVQVPAFINEGERIKVNTSHGSYFEQARREAPLPPIRAQSADLAPNSRLRYDRRRLVFLTVIPLRNERYPAWRPSEAMSEAPAPESNRHR
jgi:elongation factor P